ncbi:hypothetical protein SERLA73DRAFT_187285 [Serpula lacrymans var. lacrymans S7.3]|uniref:Uncharacterized protein n=2 Tax=Serpula lacrymans var. lacrymans TaxID=341189 RepID=F8Q8V6_SERL3|nr:uncharacterized protein SERLADRAFT_476745 [Serpula lacrymans var. lacrymans S7.9]EGN95011.1 hypothetical protein SERLA73DRAFT_187285 [Serpula lacrymans var. lacrymans S7.3]EGO20507.1 hypothetical protein SERLADRAFT_476745 [Serpula lacrymans var. lacrymans S7.9]
MSTSNACKLFVPTVDSVEKIYSEELKEVAKQHFNTKRYHVALSIYTFVLVRRKGCATTELLRTIRCNRAECYYQLGSYHSSVSDCLEVIDSASSPYSNLAITRKAYFRLARSHRGLRQPTEALEALESSKEVTGRFNEAEQKLYNDLLAAKAQQDRRREPHLRASPPQEQFEVNANQGDSSDTCTVHYLIKFPNTGDCLSLSEIAPVRLIQRPIRDDIHALELDLYMRSLFLKRGTSILASRRWFCAMCDQDAKTMRQDHLPEVDPHVMDPPVVAAEAVPFCGESCLQQYENYGKEYQRERERKFGASPVVVSY